jgi:nucleotide-binding universal stress UspA family protein
MFERILVPLDGSTRAERALPIAARVARTTGGTLVLLRVVNIPGEHSSHLMQGLAFIRRVTGGELEAKQYLASIAKLDALADIPIETEVLHGKPALALLDAIPEHHIDSVIICSRGHTGAKRWVLGSVALEIAQYSSVPVLILHEDHVLPPDFYPEARPPIRIFGIVIALDGSERTLTSLEPAAYLAAAMAAPTGGILHLTQVLPLPPTSGVDESIDLAIQGQVLSAAKKYMSRLADDLREGLAKKLNLQVNWSIIVDTDVAHGLMTEAETRQASNERYEFIAMTTQAERSHWLTSTVTEDILSVNQLPLLIVPPQETETKPEQAELELMEAEPHLVKF